MDRAEREFSYKVERERRQSFREDEALEGNDGVIPELMRRQTLLLEQLLAKDPKVEVNLNTEGPRGATGAPLGDAFSQSAEPTDNVMSSAQLMRELSHSLNTPLSQIEATVLTQRASPGGDDTERQQVLGQIQESVEICKAFLAAFSALTRVATAGSGWNPASLEESVKNAAALYAAAKGRNDLSFSVDLADHIHGYDNAFVTATILPLLENAVEAASVESKVDVRSISLEDHWEIYVENVKEGGSISQEIFKPGVTTKKGHDGLGLSVVQGLIGRKGGALTMESSDTSVRFTVTLPQGDL